MSSTIQELKSIFNNAGKAIEFSEAIANDCMKAQLHAIADDCYSELSDAYHLIQEVCQIKNCHPCDVSIAILKNYYPNLEFIENSGYGIQYKRGKLFHLSEYVHVKELISKLSDDFEKKYFEKFGTKPDNDYWMFKNERV